MVSSYAGMPSSLGMKLLASSNSAIDASGANDLATYVDVTPFESILVLVISAKLAGETGADVTITALHDTASNGASATAVNDRDGNPLSMVMGGSAAAGRGMSMQIRTRGLKQYFSPALLASGAAVTCSVAVYGIGPRDTSETSGHWTDEVGAVVANTAIA